MTDPLFGPIDDDIYRAIEADVGPQQARFIYDLTLVAVNYDDRPDQLDHLIHKWALTGPELESAKDFIFNGPIASKGADQ